MIMRDYKKTNECLRVILLVFCSLMLLFVLGTISPVEAKTNKAKEVDVQWTGNNRDCGTFVTETGDLWMWGNKKGYLGDNIKPQKIMSNVETVTMEYSEVGVIKKDGSLWMWGPNTYGMLGDGTETARYKPVHIMDDVKSMSIGYWHCAAVKTDGSLWTWGCNDGFPLGVDDYSDHLIPVKIMDDVKTVSAAFQKTAAVKTDGSLWTWGYNLDGVLGNGTTESAKKPKRIMGGVEDVRIGDYACMIIKKDGSLWACGNSYVLGAGTSQDEYSPVWIMNDVSEADVGAYMAAAVQKDGWLSMWGSYNLENVLFSPELMFDNVKRISLTPGSPPNLTGVIKTDGSVWMFRSADTFEKAIANIKKIYPFDISKANVKLIKKTPYNGNTKKPKPKVIIDGKTLKNGVDYTLKYTKNKKVGTARVSILGKGDYAGTKKKSFIIVPKGTVITRLLSTKKTVTVKWKRRTAQTSGYQIKYSTWCDFSADNKTVTIKNARTTKRVIKKMKSQNDSYIKNYIKIRTYKTVNGKRYYSAWSKTKSVTVK